MNEINLLGTMDWTMDHTHESANRVYGVNGVAPTLPTCCGGGHQPKILEVSKMTVKVKQADKQGYAECEVPGVADLSYTTSKTRRGRVIKGGQICPTLTTENIPSVLEDWMWEVDGIKYLIRIRKLTPKECFALMGFTERDYEKAAEVCSNTQLYKQAGNSIAKNCLCYLFKSLLSEDLYTKGEAV